MKITLGFILWFVVKILVSFYCLLINVLLFMDTKQVYKWFRTFFSCWYHPLLIYEKITDRSVIETGRNLNILYCILPLKANARKFPHDFLFGSATSAFQIEGAWNTDGKAPSIWDTMTHDHPELIKERANANIAADSYHNYKRDVEMLRELGVDIYRFSVSWSRILPTGFSNKINIAGVNFYNNYIDELLKYNITPFLTLFHWDLPQSLQDLGGFANPLFADWFEDYARVVFYLFGDRVKYFITFNEPFEFCTYGYGSGEAPPQVVSSGIGEYLCLKNTLISHARAYRLYDTDFRKDQNGKVGISLSVPWFIAHTESPEDMLAAELKRQAFWGIIADPIFSQEGGFPKELLQRVAEKSLAQGFSKSRLIDFTEEERKMIQGTHDFMGVNYYRNALISATEGEFSPAKEPSIGDDIRCGMIVPDFWWKSSYRQLEIPPHGILNTLLQLHAKYNTTFYVTENGIPTGAGLHDDERVFYFRSQLLNILDALDAGVNLKGYMAWSLMDTFEWIYGYSEFYGLYEINFNDPRRTRRPRKSAFVLKNIISHRTVNCSFVPTECDRMTIAEGH